MINICQVVKCISTYDVDKACLFVDGKCIRSCTKENHNNFDNGSSCCYLCKLCDKDCSVMKKESGIVLLMKRRKVQAFLAAAGDNK